MHQRNGPAGIGSTYVDSSIEFDDNCDGKINDDCTIP
jgi:hypothetical protein